MSTAEEVLQRISKDIEDFSKRVRSVVNERKLIEEDAKIKEAFMAGFHSTEHDEEEAWRQYRER